MFRTSIYICLIFFLGIEFCSAQTDYYSRNATRGGNWSSVNSWTLNADGSGGPATSVPQRNDYVTILNGHTISINYANDNGSSGISLNSLNATFPNVGIVTGSSNFTNSGRFYQTGDVTINSGGTLQITRNVGLVFAGFTEVFGTLDVDASGASGNQDLVNIGFMRLNVGSSVFVGNDFVISGSSETIVDISFTNMADDIYIDNTDARICGSGSLTLDDIIQITNGADAFTQACAGFTINCGPSTCDCRINTNPSNKACEGTNPLIGLGDFTLPVELLFFNGEAEGTNVAISWATASETNNDYFTLERSYDGIHFYELSTMQGAGHSVERLNYEYTDHHPIYGISYYRLKQTDFDGQFEYFNIIAVHIDGGLDDFSFTLFPNPTNEKLDVQYAGNAALDVEIEVYSAHGQLQDNITPIRKIYGFELNVGELNTGIYLLHLVGSKFRRIRKFIKQ